MKHVVLRFPPSHCGNGSSLESSLAWPDGDEWDKREQEERKFARQEWLHIQCFGEDTKMHGPGIVVKTDSRRQMTSNSTCFSCFTFGRCWEENWNGVVKMSKWFHSIQYVLLSWHTVSPSTFTALCWVPTWSIAIKCSSLRFPKGPRRMKWSSEARARDRGERRKERINMLRVEGGKRVNEKKRQE